jgi:hypothetical protein
MLDLWEGGTVKLPNLDCLQGYKLTELQRDHVGCEGFEPKRLLVKSCPACTFSISFLVLKSRLEQRRRSNSQVGPFRLLAKAVGCYALLS